MNSAKKIKITYWTSTGLVGAMMLMSSMAYFTMAEAQQNFVHLGFPDYFRIELGIAKILGAIALLAPQTKILKEWAYAGFTISFVSAAIAHTASGDPMGAVIPPLFALGLLAVSYISNKKRA